MGAYQTSGSAGSKTDDERKAAAANERVKALDTEIVTPGEGLGLAARLAKMKAEKAKAAGTPTPTPDPKKKKKIPGEEQKKALTEGS